MNFSSKPQKWESLRLSLQEFVPQEYVATCWILALECKNNYNYIGQNSNGNHPLTHGNNHKLTLLAKDEAERATLNSTWHTIIGRAGSAHNNATQATLWYYQTPSNGYHVYNGETWQEHSHS